MRYILLLFCVALSGCANFSLRDPWASTAVGLAGGSAGALALTKNKEHQGKNMAITGAALGLAMHLGAKFLWGKEIDPAKAEILELRAKNLRPAREITVPAANQKLPDFLEKRLTPLVLEQWVENDSISEDGSLNEPHKVWRIKRHPELIPQAK